MPSPNLFGLDIAGIVTTSIQQAGGLVAGTLTKVTFGAYDVNNPSSGRAQTTAAYPCQVAATDYVIGSADKTLSRRIKGEIVVLLRTLPDGVVPALGDMFTFVPPTGGAARTFTITGDVDVDAAGATATCASESAPA